MKKLCYLLCIALLLNGCANNKKVAPTEGRIAIHTGIGNQIEQAQTSVKTETPLQNVNWIQASGNAQNLMPHGQLKSNATKIWSRNIGAGLSGKYFVLPEPIIVDGIIYALDGAFRLSAVDETTGKQLWRKELPTSKDMSMSSIGLASDGTKLYIANGNGMIYATGLDGNIQWEHNTNAILRSAPTVANGLLYVLSGNNELFVLKTSDGSQAWHYGNIATDTNLFGMGQPAVANNVVVVPFSSGEIIAFDAQSGMILWADTLLSHRTFNQINDLSHVIASPVIENETVYLIGNAQKTGAFDLKSGAMKFIQNIGGQNTPIVNGNSIFMVTTRNAIVALDKENGSLIWETELTSKESKGIAWKGPVLANNQLLVVSNKGDVVFVDALNGTIKQTIKTDSLSNKPILGKDKVILFTDDADLITYQ